MSSQRCVARKAMRSKGMRRAREPPGAWLCSWSLNNFVMLQTFMQPAGATAPSMAPHEGVTSSDGRGIEGAGIGLDTADPITKDHSPTSQTNPYLVTGRKGIGSPAPLAVTPGGV